MTPRAVLLARPHHWSEARQWLWGMLIGGCLPFWGGWFVLRLFARSIGLVELTGRGELVLFSAGIFASAIPIIRRSREEDAVVLPGELVTVCVALLMLAAFVVSAVTVADAFPQMPRPAASLMIALSLGLFLASIAIGFYVELANNVRGDPTLFNVIRNDENDLRERFNRYFEE